MSEVNVAKRWGNTIVEAMNGHLIYALSWRINWSTYHRFCMSWWDYSGARCNSPAKICDTCSMKYTSSKLPIKTYMSIPHIVSRVPVRGVAWTILLERHVIAASTSGRTITKTIWVTYCSATEESVIGVKATHCPKMIPIQTNKPVMGKYNTRRYKHLSNDCLKKNPDFPVNSILCHSLIQLR